MKRISLSIQLWLLHNQLWRVSEQMFLKFFWIIHYSHTINYYGPVLYTFHCFLFYKKFYGNSSSIKTLVIICKIHQLIENLTKMFYLHLTLCFILFILNVYFVLRKKLLCRYCYNYYCYSYPIIKARKSYSLELLRYKICKLNLC